MSNTVQAIPEGYQAATPYLSVKGAAKAIEFYKEAFGAVEVMRMGGPEGRIGHAEIKIGAAPIMLADEFPEMDVVGPETLGGSPVTLHIYFEDVDAVAERAIAAGAKILRPIENQFYGDRAGLIQDPFGHRWWISTHIEDVSPEEMERRAAAAFGQ